MTTIELSSKSRVGLSRIVLNKDSDSGSTSPEVEEEKGPKPIMSFDYESCVGGKKGVPQSIIDDFAPEDIETYHLIKKKSKKINGVERPYFLVEYFPVSD